MQFVSELSGKHKQLKPERLRGENFASFKTEEEADLPLSYSVFVKSSHPCRP